jgi:hypothetical protein
MIASTFDRHCEPALRTALSLALCVLLTVCAAPSGEVKWVKSGTDDRTMQRELNDCVAQANAAMSHQSGINQDINATLGRNWQLSQTTSIVDQNMVRQTTALGDQVLNNCMRNKGFVKQG